MKNDNRFRKKPIYSFFKRLFDILFSFIGMIVLIPIFIIVGIIIKCSSKGPVFFKQKRVGINEKPIYIHKFRSMKMAAPCECATNELENADSYITKFGKFIRKTSIDELPQLFDIFVGKMSIIGPRPIIFTEVELMKLRKEANVYRIKPGLTGLAQISGRDLMNIHIKAQIDAEYTRRRNFFLDFLIFFKTIFYVLFRRGIHEGKGEASDIE